MRTMMGSRVVGLTMGLTLALAASALALPATGLAHQAGVCGASTQSATGITGTSATLNGTRLSNAGAGKFDWGLTTSYGNTTTPTASGSGAYSTTITGLAPGTTYHYRASCNTNGSDVSFTTVAATTTAPPATTTAPPATTTAPPATTTAPPAGSESADLGVVKTVTPASVAVGSMATFKIVATNVVGSTAINAFVTDQLSAGLSLVTATATQGSCSGTTLVTCTMGTLASGRSVTITIVVSAATAGTVKNTAGIGATNPDPNIGGNNHSSATLVVTGAGPTTTAGTAPKPSPPPPVTRVVSARVSAASIKGTVGTRPSAPACSTGVRVRLERAGNPGKPATLVATKRTGPSGGFSFARPKRAGTYRAIAPRVVVGGRTCLAARSRGLPLKAS